MLKRPTKLIIVAMLIALSFSSHTGFALEVPPAPSLDAPIVDATDTLSSEQIATLNQQIQDSRQQKAYEFAILMIPSLQNESLENYSLKVARTWGVGSADKDNGVLLLIVKDDQRIRIEVGRGLEGDLTDIEAGRIIRNSIAPLFQKGDYFSGISQGVQNIAAQVEGRPEWDNSLKSANQLSSEETVSGMLFIALPLVSWFFAIMARTKSWWLGGAVGAIIGLIVAVAFAWVFWTIGLMVGLALIGLLLDWAVSKNYAEHARPGDQPSWWAGGPWLGGGGSFGGGSGGFGGGGFSGGGASGRW